ncbi:hypothetical protein MCW82_07085 [Azospirillum doebereinerae]|uniref:hypothetical protein n=1 Tax=Azospirillum doebereinerae TaxID=92933 RepID=UPI001EE5E0C1|nr:hypothetical protein [Azospirillum doebereinerae]MCG5239531.1 hypothetical protein [Azospirillum doebereinerae]
MRVMFRSSLAHPDGSYSAGDVADLPDARAAALLSAGIVALVETAAAASTETAAVAPAETATAPARRRGATRGA